MPPSHSCNGLYVRKSGNTTFFTSTDCHKLPGGGVSPAETCRKHNSPSSSSSQRNCLQQCNIVAGLSGGKEAGGRRNEERATSNPAAPTLPIHLPLSTTNASQQQHEYAAGTLQSKPISREGRCREGRGAQGFLLLSSTTAAAFAIGPTRLQCSQR